MNFIVFVLAARWHNPEFFWLIQFWLNKFSKMMIYLMTREKLIFVSLSAYQPESRQIIWLVWLVLFTCLCSVARSRRNNLISILSFFKNLIQLGNLILENRWLKHRFCPIDQFLIDLLHFFFLSFLYFSAIKKLKKLIFRFWRISE